jgi:hypothetical protein
VIIKLGALACVNEGGNVFHGITLSHTTSIVTRVASGFIGVYASPRGLSYA